MRHDHLDTLLFQARQRDLEQHAQQARLAAEVRRQPKQNPAGRLSRLRERLLASNTRINLGVEEPA